MHDRKMKNLILSALAGLVFLSATAAKASSEPCNETLLKRIPARSPTALEGSAFAHEVEGLREGDRDIRIEEELLAGNMPQSLHHLRPVTFHGLLPGGAMARLTICVHADYLAIGSDRDSLLVPMRLATALRVARRFGFLLPTSKMVDAIYEQAQTHLTPQPLPAGDRMRSTDYYEHHNQLIALQRASLGAVPGSLISGHKKDLVLTNLLWRNSDRVAIYGWHYASQRPIQPLSTVHGARYADYSHGVRLVSDTAYLNGAPVSLLELLKDPILSHFISGEGPIAHLPELIDRLAVREPYRDVRDLSEGPIAHLPELIDRLAVREPYRDVRVLVPERVSDRR